MLVALKDAKQFAIGLSPCLDRAVQETPVNRSEASVIRRVREVYTHRGRRLEDLVEGLALPTAFVDRLAAPFLEPDQRWTVATHNGRPLLLINLGYWAGEKEMTEAQVALVHLLAGYVPNLSGARVLDVGSGLAGPAIILASQYGAEVDCLNVVEQQVRWSNELIAWHGLQDRVRVHLGSACDMPFAHEAFDVVFCLEAAHCFADKPRFIAEARRVLRPGGTMVMADAVATSQNYLLRWEWLAQLHLVTWADWRGFILASGLSLEKERSIAKEVYPGFMQWVDQERAIHPRMLRGMIRRAWVEERGWWSRLRRLTRLPLQLLAVMPLIVRRHGARLLWKRDYVLCVARK